MKALAPARGSARPSGRARDGLGEAAEPESGEPALQRAAVARASAGSRLRRRGAVETMLWGGEAAAPAPEPNRTGLPDRLKAGVEALSGVSLDHVQVHYNSAEPARVAAHAYTQGGAIHLARGQERHLPHEAWHAAQQSLGRVGPTTTIGGRGVNADARLENEADVMGARAMAGPAPAIDPGVLAGPESPGAAGGEPAIQRVPVNPAYDAMIEGGEIAVNDDGYMAALEVATDPGRPIAFIVNAILPYSQIGQIPTVVERMLAGLPERLQGRVGFVFGVNAKATKAKLAALDEALRAAAEVIAKIQTPIALVRLTFSGDFPYGTMRNGVMESAENRGLIGAFVARGWYPYLSVQDFDTGLRQAPSGLNIFEHFDTLLSQEPEGEPADADRDQPPEPMPPMRPLLMVGGYRPGPQEELATATLGKKGLGAKTRKQLADKEGQAEFYREFSKLISLDMRSRENLARVHPLLPYAPEPNLFIDALPVLARKTLKFGKDGAEFTNLGKDANRLLGDELLKYYTPPGAPTPRRPPSCRRAIRPGAPNPWSIRCHGTAAPMWMCP